MAHLFFLNLTTGLLLGLASGVYCLGSCVMVMAPHLATGSESDGFRTDLLRIVEFSLGRFLTYFLIGLLLFLVGPPILETQAAQLIMAGGILTLAVLMLANGVARGFPVVPCCAKLGEMAWLRRYPLLTGMLSAARVCPPVLLCFSQVTVAGAALPAVTSMCGFFLGTFVVTLPISLAGSATRWPEVRATAAIASLFCGLWFASVGVARIVNVVSCGGLT